MANTSRSASIFSSLSCGTRPTSKSPDLAFRIEPWLISDAVETLRMSYSPDGGARASGLGSGRL
eukprot:1007125-Amorphochlora_amoeboformis.AAC.1